MNEFKLQPRHRVGLACAKHSNRYAITQVKAENLGNGNARLTATDGCMLVQAIGRTDPYTYGDWSATNIDAKSVTPAKIVKEMTDYRENEGGLSFSVKATEPSAGESASEFPRTDDILVSRSPHEESLVVSVKIGLLRTLLDAMEDQELSASDRKSQVLTIQVSRSSIAKNEPGAAGKPIRFMTSGDDGHQVVGMLMPVNNDIGNATFDEKYARRAQ
jgi:hypothetical protein